MNSNMNFDGSNYTRSKIHKYHGGGLYVYGSHILDLVYNFLGETDSMHFIQKNAFGDVKSEGCDNGLAILEYKHGTGTIGINLAAGNGYSQRGIVIYGDKGCAEIHPMEAGGSEGHDKTAVMSISTRCGSESTPFTSKPLDLSAYNFDRRYLYMMKNFAYLVKGNDYKDEIYFECDYQYEKTLHELLLKMIYY